MANELVINTTSGLTLYALLFDATGQVWNGAAFEACQAANWTDYDIAMTEVATTGVYLGTMPAVAAGAYAFAVRRQAGAGPAVGDVTAGAGELLWTGTAEDSTTNSALLNEIQTLPAAPSAADVADAVWDEAIAGHAVAGSAGAALSAASAAGDPWLTELPGAYAAGSAGEILGNMNPTVAISSTTAASVSSGAIGIRTHHTLAQAITSTYAGNLNAATKLWLAIKLERDDADSAAVAFIEKTAGLTVLAQAAYTTVAHGTLVVGGLAGAWTVTIGMDEVATGLLTSYAESMLRAECKALVGGATVALWDGVCDISRGIVQAVA